MKRQQIKLSLVSIIILGLLFSSIQLLVPVDGLADDVFYPRYPCRIADSRPSSYANPQGFFIGPFDVGETICYKNYGSGAFDIGPQGGNSSGCYIPYMGMAPNDEYKEPTAFHVVVTAVPVRGRGHLRIYPANATTAPVASILSWNSGVGNISNAVTAESYDEYRPDTQNEFCIYVGGYAGGQTHIVMDVMGFFGPAYPGCKHLQTH
jgi:hypothetical protein